MNYDAENHQDDEEGGAETAALYTAKKKTTTPRITKKNTMWNNWRQTTYWTIDYQGSIQEFIAGGEHRCE